MHLGYWTVRRDVDMISVMMISMMKVCNCIVIVARSVRIEETAKPRGRHVGQVGVENRQDWPRKISDLCNKAQSASGGPPRSASPGFSWRIPNIVDDIT